MASKHLLRRLVSSPWIHNCVFADPASYTQLSGPHSCGRMCHNWWARISGCWMVCDTEGSKDMTPWDAWTPQAVDLRECTITTGPCPYLDQIPLYIPWLSLKVFPQQGHQSNFNSHYILHRYIVHYSFIFNTSYSANLVSCEDDQIYSKAGWAKKSCCLLIMKTKHNSKPASHASDQDSTYAE